MRIPTTALAVALVCGTAAAVLAQTATESATDRAVDSVIARRALMLAVDNAMFELEEAVADPAGREPFLVALRAADVAAMLRGAALLFPPESNFAVLGQPDDPGAATLAGASIWEDAATFHADMTAAARLAEEASLAPDLETMAPLIGQLRDTCGACHDRHMSY